MEKNKKMNNGRMTICAKKTLQRQENKAKKEEIIPVVEVERELVYVTQQKPGNCKGGDITACQNYSWCAQCVAPERGTTAPVNKTSFKEIVTELDTAAYAAQKK